ncbi:hypothetical protein D3C76_1638410 [compost metagenome]
MEVAALDQVVGQPLGRDEPAAALFAVDQPLGFELHQRLTQGNARGIEHLAELALGRQLAARRQQAVLDLLLQGVTDGCYRTRWHRLHQRLPIWTSPAPEQGTWRIVQA